MTKLEYKDIQVGDWLECVDEKIQQGVWVYVAEVTNITRLKMEWRAVKVAPDWQIDEDTFIELHKSKHDHDEWDGWKICPSRRNVLKARKALGL